MTRIDLNSDMGERPEALRDGSEEELMRYVSSANIACGGHAGDDSTMDAVVSIAKRYGVSVGAHPSFPDRENFGRLEMKLRPEEIEQCVFDQVRRLAELAKLQHVELRHVKPHGALYNVAVLDVRIAEAIAKGVEKYDKSLTLFGLAGSRMIDVWQDLGMRIAREAFADRSYEADGSLRSRKFHGALITDPSEAAQRAVLIAREGVVKAVDGTMLSVCADTICIHSDTPNSTRIAEAVRRALEKAGIAISPVPNSSSEK
jgi:UPF0271 protein